MDLNNVFHNQINLYELLGIDVEGPEDLEKLSPLQVRRSFRLQALKHHPDKSREGSGSRQKFYQLDAAAKILSDPKLRRAYDQWFVQIFFEQQIADEARKEKARKLYQRERAVKREGSHKTPDLATFEEHGQYLRKLKHFKLPYGDWKHINRSPGNPNHKLTNSCTLRFEMQNHKLLQSKQELNDLLSNALQVQLIDLYYSPRNNYNADSTIVAYAVLANIHEVLRVLAEWDSRKPSSGSPFLSYVEDISPKIPRSSFKFTNKEQMNPCVNERMACRSLSSR
ncbi:LAQU0S15e02234g1_1 [Lachancea quebecensis]|uniref:LAQU0S15e02234g1_1 n=1 Tax=Lachancea quebecensis TaxID=1654605 RepID=A0A0N7MM78_9SACH|nr:LAQU0S15e02234g1_1 [Lachancea quebecensis]